MQLKNTFLIFITGVLFLFNTATFGQVTDINFTPIDQIIQNGKIAFVTPAFDIQKNNSQIKYTDKFEIPLYILSEDVTKKIIFQFALTNKTNNPTSYYFFPGKYFTNTILYKRSGEQLVSLPSISPNLANSISFRQFTIGANDSLIIVAEIFQLKSYTNFFKPTLINSQYVSTYLEKLQNEKKGEGIITYFFCGMLLMMIIYSSLVLWRGGSKAYIYYSTYALLLCIMLFTKHFYFGQISKTNFIFESYLDFLLQGIGMCFYLIFMNEFLECKIKYPFLNKLLFFFTVCLVLILIGFSYRHFYSNDFYIENLLENTIGKGLLLLVGFIMLVYGYFNWADIFLRYVAVGTFLYLLLSSVSLIMIWGNPYFSSNHILRSGLFWYELGLFCELLFFLMGLVYKNRKELIQYIKEGESLKMEKAKQELEKEKAIINAKQMTRNKIAADVHDELGAGVTHIRLLSEILKSKSNKDISKEIDKISIAAADLLKKMSMLAWSINNKNDSLQNLISYIQKYTNEYFEGTNFKHHVNIPKQIPDKELAGEARRNVVLCIKEILNNIVKHANATTITIKIETNSSLKIKFIDDGIGFERNPKNEFGSGLKNMEQRMEEIGGTISVESNGNGTAVILELIL